MECSRKKKKTFKPSSNVDGICLKFDNLMIIVDLLTVFHKFFSGDFNFFKVFEFVFVHEKLYFCIII